MICKPVDGNFNDDDGVVKVIGDVILIGTVDEYIRFVTVGVAEIVDTDNELTLKLGAEDESGDAIVIADTAENVRAFVAAIDVVLIESAYKLPVTCILNGDDTVMPEGAEIEFFESIEWK